MRKLLMTITAQWNPPRDRVLWAPVFLGAGIAGYFALPVEPGIGPGAGALAGAVLAVMLATRRAPALVYPLFCLMLMALGFVLAQGRTLAVQGPMLEKPIAFARVEGRVMDVSVADEEGGKKPRRRVMLDRLAIEDLPPADTPRRIRLSSYHIPADVVPGERIAVLARLLPPSGPVAPGGFDYRRHAFFEGIGANGFTMGKFERIAADEAYRSGETWFSQLRQRISKRINGALPHPESSVTMALLAGERASIPDTVNQTLIDSGLYHLLSISGLHVAIVCGVVFFTLRFSMALWPAFALRVPIKKIAAAAALVAGLFYMMLAGAPVPTQRAMIMTGLVLMAVMLDRSALSMRTIAIAAFVLLALRPEAVTGPSFQLSFAAVLSMVAFHEGIGRRLMAEGRDASLPVKVIAYLAGIAATTVLVGLATAPIVLHHFGRMQLYGVIGNALAIPLTSFIIMPAGMAALLTMPLGLEQPFLSIAGWGVARMLDIAAWVAGLPHAAFTLPGLPLGAYLLSCAGFLVTALWRGVWRWAGAAIMITAIAAGFTVPRPLAILDAEGRSLGIAAGGEVAYALKTPSKFMRENWLGLWGGLEVNGGKPVQQFANVLACDDFACRMGAHVSIVKSRTAMAEECGWAKTIVALDKSIRGDTPCGARIVTFWDVRESNGVWISRTGAVHPVVSKGERRPWTARPRRQ